jgi:hypothetical protein
VSEGERALNLIIEQVEIARAALADEHEGRFTEAVETMHAVTTGLVGLVRAW